MTKPSKSRPRMEIVMKKEWNLQQRALVLTLAFLTLTPLLVLLGIPDVVQAGTSQSASIAASITDRGSLLLSLDPHNALHRLVLLPLFAALAVLVDSVAVWVILRRWRGSNRQRMEIPSQDIDKGALATYGLLGFLSWIALSFFLLLDLVGSVSLYPWVIAFYAVLCVLIALSLLYPRPRREKAVVLSLILITLCTTRFIDWNSRKPFLEDLYRVQVGMTEPQASRIMEGYLRSGSPATAAEAQGQGIAGTVSYRHTTEAWGNSDIGSLTFENGRVVAVEFLGD